MSVNEHLIYDAALARWGYDKQVLKTIEECGELAGALSRFLSQGQNVRQVCEEAADVEIMLGQLRFNGLGSMVEDEKNRKLLRLSQRLLAQAEPEIDELRPNIAGTFNEALDDIEQAQALYHRGFGTAADKRRAAQFIRRAIGQLWQVAQHCVSEAQRTEAKSQEQQQ